MSSRKDARLKHKGRRSGHTFLALPHYMLDHLSYTSLSDKAKSMLIEVSRQYNGSNNGDLAVTRKLLLPRGWTSNSAIYKTKNELVRAGFIVLTRQGGRRMPNLYAITWQPVDECGGKLEVSATKVATNNWKNHRVFSEP